VSYGSEIPHLTRCSFSFLEGLLLSSTLKSALRFVPARSWGLTTISVRGISGLGSVAFLPKRRSAADPERLRPSFFFLYFGAAGRGPLETGPMSFPFFLEGPFFRRTALVSPRAKTIPPNTVFGSRTRFEDLRTLYSQLPGPFKDHGV